MADASHTISLLTCSSGLHFPGVSGVLAVQCKRKAGMFCTWSETLPRAHHSLPEFCQQKTFSARAAIVWSPTQRWLQHQCTWYFCAQSTWGPETNPNKPLLETVDRSGSTNPLMARQCGRAIPLCGKESVHQALLYLQDCCTSLFLGCSWKGWWRCRHVTNRFGFPNPLAEAPVYGMGSNSHHCSI